MNGREKHAHTHAHSTQHTAVLSYLLMHQSFLQQPDMKREGGEIHNEFQSKTAKIYKI